MKKSELTQVDIQCFLDDIEVQYGGNIMNSCKSAIDNTKDDEEVQWFRILNNALRDNPDPNFTSAADIRFDSE